MCSFMKFRCKIRDIEKNTKLFYDILDVKGGDSYEIVLQIKKLILRMPIVEGEYSNDKIENLSKTISIYTSALQHDKIATVLCFSRLTPEMEEQSVSNQPYITSDNRIIAVHGTIPQAEEIAKQYGFHIQADTDIFKYLPFEKAVDETEKVGGKISCISMGDTENYYNNGLGLYEYDCNVYNEDSINIITNIRLDKLKSSFYNILKTKLIKKMDTNIPMNTSSKHLVALYSGGLDITISVQKQIELFEYDSIELVYFDWGTVASEYEIKQGKKFVEYLNSQYDIEFIQHIVQDIKPMFKNILEVCDLKNTRLIDSEAKGAGSHEAEAAISYVPFRNTFLMTLIAARYEANFPGSHIDFVIGNNLSEGMVYLDNSETWLDEMNALIKVGGQSTLNFNVVAPYVNRTKTDMVKDAILHNFSLDSFSCYFPKDGKECGKCGSCLLKKAAIERNDAV